MTLYLNCSELSIYLFHKIVETEDLRFLVKEWDEKKQIKADIDLPGAWDAIYQQYCDLVNDNSAITLFKLKRRVAYLKSMHYMCNVLLFQMIIRPDMPEEVFKQYTDGLAAWGIVYSKPGFDLDEMEKTKRYLRAITNEISLKENQLAAFSESKPLPLTKQVVMVEQALNRNFIDPKTTSVEKWVYMMDEIKRINESRKKSSSSGKL